MSITAQYDIAEIKRAKDAKNFITNLYNEVKKYNEGKTGTTKAKKGINVKIVKRPGSTAHVKTTKTTLKENLKSEGLKLTHGYSLANRKIGAIKDEYRDIIIYETEISKIKSYIKNAKNLTQKQKNEYAKQC